MARIAKFSIAHPAMVTPLRFLTDTAVGHEFPPTKPIPRIVWLVESVGDSDSSSRSEDATAEQSITVAFFPAPTMLTLAGTYRPYAIV